MADSTTDHRRGSALLVGIYLIAGLVVGALIGLLAGSWWIGALLGLFLAAALVGVAYVTGPKRVLRAIHAVPGEGQQLARLDNLVEGLCVTHGVAKPAVQVIDDPAINAAVVGTDPKRATIAVSTGMLQSLGRIELEAVVAHLLSRIRSGDIVPATVAAALFGGVPIRTLLVVPGWDLQADAQAWRMTRYPPGLIGALEKIRAGSSVVRFASSFGTQLWFANPLAGGDESGNEKAVRSLFDAHAPIEHRIVPLQEL